MGTAAALLCSFLVGVALLAQSVAALAAPSPWPIGYGHDSSASFAAGPSVPVAISYTGSILPIQASSSDSVQIPAAGYIVSATTRASNLTLYNRTNGKVTTLSGPSSAPFYVQGFDAYSSWRLYYYFPGSNKAVASLGAYAPLTGTQVWQLNTTALDFDLDSYTDSFDVLQTAVNPARVTRYQGATGNPLWSVTVGAVHQEPYVPKLLCTFSSNSIYAGARAVQYSNGNIAALDAATGKTLWTFTNFHPIINTVSFGGVLVVSINFQMIYPTLFAISEATGNLLWNDTNIGCELLGQNQMITGVRLSNSTYGFVVPCYSPAVKQIILVAIDAQTGAVLGNATAGSRSVGTVWRASIGSTVFFTSNTVLFNWNVLTGVVNTVWADTVALFNVCVDNDGSLVVVANSAEDSSLRVISPA